MIAARRVPLAAILIAACCLSCGGPRKPEPRLPVALPPGAHLLARFSPGEEAHSYRVAVRAGHLLHVVADQQGVDVVLSLRRPDGRVLREIDSPNRSWGPEALWWIAPRDGAWSLEVRPLSATGQGTYELRIFPAGLPTPDDRLRVAAEDHLQESERLGARGERLAERRELAASRDLWQRAGEPLQEGLTDLRLASSSASDGTGEEVASHRAALGIFHRIGDHRQEVYTRMLLGEALRRTGDLQGALEAQSSAAQLARQFDFPEDAADALYNLAKVHEARGEIRTALACYRDALPTFRRLGQRGSMANGLQNLGVLSSRLGLLDEAEEDLGEALSLRRDLGDSQGQAGSLTELGWVYHLRGLEGGGPGALEKAQATLEQACLILQATPERAGLAAALGRLGTVFRETRRWDQALDSYFQSLGLVLHEPPGPNLPNALINLAELRLDRQDFARARRLAASAVSRFALLPIPDPSGEAHARFLLGRAAAGLGDLDTARREIERALVAMEHLRSRLGDETLTLPFFQLRQLYFDGAVEALMDLEERRPGHDFAAQALVACERGHMRTLVDGIAERQRQDSGGQETQESEEEPPLSIAGIEELLDPETTLLEFDLTGERGYLWIVDHGRFSVHSLPGRRDLAPLVSEVRREILDPHAGQKASRRLAHLLLRPLGDRPGIRRLAVVAGGLLGNVPFAALPWGPHHQPLVARYEIVRLPSASTLLALRRRRTAFPARPGASVAVLADPVFSPADPRVRGRDGGPGAPEPADRRDLARAVRDLDLEDLARLPATRREADAISHLAPGTFVALGFAASRETLATPAVRAAAILHFATHGLVHPVNPALSGLVLSLVDSQGRPQPGFLRAGEIAGLEIQANLVVLSACQTALGPDIAGEGLMGLGRSFLHAGADRVVVSLWSVDDAPSATFMTRFYEGLLRDRLPAAAALRRAQLAVRADPRTADTFYWGGYELQGDWR